MLILEWLLFLHCSSYPLHPSHDSFTVFLKSPLLPCASFMKPWSKGLLSSTKDTCSFDFQECFNLAQLPTSLTHPASTGVSQSSQIIVLCTSSSFLSFILHFYIFCPLTHSSFFPSTSVNFAQSSGHKPSPSSSMNPTPICGNHYFLSRNSCSTHNLL